MGHTIISIYAYLASLFLQGPYAIPATHFSIDRDNWDSVLPCITPEMFFRARPPGTAIPIQGKLISVRHQPVECPDDFIKVEMIIR